MKNTKRSITNLYKTVHHYCDNQIVKNILGTNYRIYLYLGLEDGFNAFINQANTEGITFGDAKDINTKPYSDLLALNKDLTVSYVGMWGHQAFKHPEFSNDFIVRIDFSKYIAGDENYLYKPAL